jgi:hypothetical protein
MMWHPRRPGRVFLRFSICGFEPGKFSKDQDGALSAGMRLVLETNVLVSGLLFAGGPPSRLVKAWRA